MSRSCARRGLPLVVCLALGCALLPGAQAQSRTRKHGRIKNGKTTAKAVAQAPEGEIIGQQIRFLDGSAIRVDEIWKQGDDLWCRVGSVTQRVERSVRTIEPIRAEVPKAQPQVVAPAVEIAATDSAPPESFWIYLNGGARMRVEEVNETDAGAWYRRGNVSVFLERERIARIERESIEAGRTGWRERGWTSGSDRIDELIRINGQRFGVDPYLVFCVIEHESHFNPRAVSPKGARGLMQLMPGTARRFGVRRAFDPGENIFGGTQYLKELLAMFDGKLNLALASYNAGEGAVLKYGRNVPPYRETREYVRRITRRYGNTSLTEEKGQTSPQ